MHYTRWHHTYIQLKANGTFVHYLFPGLNRNILVLLDSSGSLSDYEFSQLLRFTSKLLRPLTLDNGNVRVGLLQVGTSPHLEFGLDVHKSQRSLQEALQTVRHLRGNTNTVEALRLAQRLLSEAEEEEPKILLWLTDGAQPGDVTEAMTELKTRGVTVMIVATVHANYHLLQQAVTPPLEANLYTVDMDDIDIITEELRKTIISMCVSLSVFFTTLKFSNFSDLIIDHKYQQGWFKTRVSDHDIPTYCIKKDKVKKARMML